MIGIQQDFFEKVRFEQRFEWSNGGSHVDIWSKTVPGRRNCNANTLMGEACLAWLANSKKARTLEPSGRGEHRKWNQKSRWGSDQVKQTAVMKQIDGSLLAPFNITKKSRLRWKISEYEGFSQFVCVHVCTHMYAGSPYKNTFLTMGSNKIWENTEESLVSHGEYFEFYYK